MKNEDLSNLTIHSPGGYQKLTRRAIDVAYELVVSKGNGGVPRASCFVTAEEAMTAAKITPSQIHPSEIRILLVREGLARDVYPAAKVA